MLSKLKLRPISTGRSQRGYVLLGLLLFFTVLGLSGTVAVLEQDTRLKRFSEEDLKLNLDALRRAIDLYRYKNGDTSLDAKMGAGPEALAEFLANESFVRARAAKGKVGWRIIQNQIKNPSFEIDDGKADLPAVGTWRGNYTANDGVPDGWQLNAERAEQKIQIPVATYVVSFWARNDTPTANSCLKIWMPVSTTSETLIASLTSVSDKWKRYFGHFFLATNSVRIEITQEGSNSGDITYIDGLMLEKWDPPPGTPAETHPVPSAWTKDYQIVAASTTEALQERAFKAELTAPAGSDISSYSWWFQW